MAEKALTGEVETGPLKISTTLMKMSVSMTAKTDPEAAQRYVDMVCVAIGKEEDNINKLRNLLGRMALAVRINKLYQPNFKLFRDYVQHLEDTHGLKTSSIYNAIGFVQQFAGVTPDQAAEIPIRNQVIAAQAARTAEPGQLKEIVRYASRPEAEYREKLQERGLLPKLGRPEGGKRDNGTVTLAVPLVSAKVAQRFRANAKEHGGPAKYLNHLLNLDRKAEAAAA